MCYIMPIVGLDSLESVENWFMVFSGLMSLGIPALSHIGGKVTFEGTGGGTDGMGGMGTGNAALATTCSNTDTQGTPFSCAGVSPSLLNNPVRKESIVSQNNFLNSDAFCGWGNFPECGVEFCCLCPVGMYADEGALYPELCVDDSEWVSDASAGSITCQDVDKLNCIDNPVGWSIDSWTCTNGLFNEPWPGAYPEGTGMSEAS